MTVRTKNHLRLFASALTICAATAATADVITLQSNDTGTQISGTVVDFDSVIYKVDTLLGQLELRADEYTCIDGNCPQTAVVARNAAEVDTVIISGSDTVGLGVMPILVSGFAGHLNAAEEIYKPDGAVEAVSKFVADDGFGDDLGSYLVRSSISSDAFANLLGLSADIGMASRRIKADEAATLAKYGAGDMTDPTNEHIIAIDSIVVVTHPDNPVNELRMEQVRDIYAGKITNWSEVGGPNAPIKAVSLADGSGTRSVFEARVFDGNVTGTPAFPVASEGGRDVALAVNNDVHAIGYVSSAFVLGSKPITLISECGIPMVPSAFSARTEEYSLGRFLYLYSRGDNTNPDVRSFLNFVTSSAADPMIAKSGFVDLGVARQTTDSARAQMLIDNPRREEREYANRMLDDMMIHDRLSATFRFDTGSTKLTPRSVLNVERLIDYAETLPKGTNLKVVGFTDSVGAFSNNLALAEGRARQVATTLQEAANGRLDHVTLSTVGYGEIAPASCNTTELGKSINRRVEIWVESGADS